MEPPRPVYPISLEIRQDGNSGRRLFGMFRYSQTATMSDRGRVRKNELSHSPLSSRWVLQTMKSI